MSNKNNSGCLASGGLILTWIILILTALGVFAFSTTWGIIFVVAVVIVKIATRTKEEISKEQENVAETEIIIEDTGINLQEIDKLEHIDDFSNINQ